MKENKKIIIKEYLRDLDIDNFTDDIDSVIEYLTNIKNSNSKYSNIELDFDIDYDSIIVGAIRLRLETDEEASNRIEKQKRSEENKKQLNLQQLEVLAAKLGKKIV
jgi:hypothetical protein